MFVRSTMRPHYQCLIAKPIDSLKYVLEKMEEEDIQAMPVVDNGHFLGMVSKQTIYESFFNSNLGQQEFLKEKRVKEIIDHEDLFVYEDEVFEKTFTTFKAFPILAVIDENKKFLGIVSRFQVLEQFESAFGLKRNGIRIAFTSEESAGRFIRLAEIIKQLDMNIISLTTFDESDILARRIVLKVDTSRNVQKLEKKLTKAGFHILDIKEM